MSTWRSHKPPISPPPLYTPIYRDFTVLVLDLTEGCCFLPRVFTSSSKKTRIFKILDYAREGRSLVQNLTKSQKRQVQYSNFLTTLGPIFENGPNHTNQTLYPNFGHFGNFGRLGRSFKKFWLGAPRYGNEFWVSCQKPEKKCIFSVLKPVACGATGSNLRSKGCQIFRGIFRLFLVKYWYKNRIFGHFTFFVTSLRWAKILRVGRKGKRPKPSLNPEFSMLDTPQADFSGFLPKTPEKWHGRTGLSFGGKIGVFKFKLSPGQPSGTARAFWSLFSKLHHSRLSLEPFYLEFLKSKTGSRKPMDFRKFTTLYCDRFTNQRAISKFF